MNILKNGKKHDIQVIEQSLSAISVNLTSRCNLSCKMCSVWKRREDDIEYDRVLSLLDEARSLGATCFGAGGGEVFMREDITDILAYAERIGFRETYVISNGVLLSNRVINKLEKLGTLNVIISLDGPQDVHDELRGKGTFKRAVEALGELRRRGVTCSISSVIMRQTLDRLTRIVDIAADLSIPVISMQPYQREISGPGKDHSAFEFNAGEEKIIRRKLRNLIKFSGSKGVDIYTENLMEWVPQYLARGGKHIPPHGCYVPSKKLVVDVSGDTYPCWMIRDTMGEKSLGNIHKKALSEIWHNDMHWELTTMAIKGKCPGCLAACSDVESYNALSQKSWLSGRPVRVMRWLTSEFLP
jgi:radical SAM protein with 4Fe4S-binding SPASM domain